MMGDQWNQQPDQGEGGGYFNDNGFGTPGALSASKTATRQQLLCPVTVRQVLEAPEDGLKVGSLTAKTVSLVGIVESVDISSINIKFTLSDDTGIIECLEWLDAEESGERKTVVNIMENAYYQVFGCIKSPQGQRKIVVFKIQPIEDLSEITQHMAEVLSVNQYAQRVQNTDAPMDSTTTSTTTSNYNFNSNVSSVNDKSAFTPVQRAILDAVRAVEGQIGWNRNDPALKSKFSAKLLEEAIEFLSGEGHIYSTVDDNHFCCT